MKVLHKFIPLASPDIQEQDIDATIQVLRSGMLVQGEKVQLFEEDVARFLGVKHAICASNGTATLHMALVALGIGQGDEVIVPAFSYIATANVVELVGATPIFVDIDLATYNIDISKVEQAISPKTKAIIPVHEFGLASDIVALKSIAERKNIALIEDAACALGAKEDNRFVGTFGDFASFSLHPRKAISSGEGGILTTNNDALAEKIRILRNHGISYQDGKMNFVAAGFNYRLTDFQAALVHSQFTRLDHTLRYKQELAKVYFQEIDSTKIKLPFIPDNKQHTWQTFHVLLDDSIDRGRLINELKREGVGTNYGAQCIPYQEYYSLKYNLNCQMLYPNALKAYNHGLALPLYEKLTKEEIAFVANTICKLIN
jgi:dTDP-4-amino-4,6-dideoxygalactose transaminase